MNSTNENKGEQSADDSVDEILEEFIEIREKYKNVPLLLNLSKFAEIPQSVIFRDLTYYKREILIKAMKILDPLTPKQLFEERANLKSKMSDIHHMDEENNPETHPYYDFELPQNIYRTVINQVLHTKLYPDNPSTSDLYKQIIEFVINSKDKDITLTSRNNQSHMLTVQSIHEERWSIGVVIIQGECVLECEWIGHDISFLCGHYNFIRTKGKIFKELVWASYTW